MSDLAPTNGSRSDTEPDVALALDNHRLGPSAACLAIGTAFLLVSNGRWIVPIAAWLAPLFLLRYVRLTRALAGLVILAVVMMAGTQVMLAGIIPSQLGLMAYFLKAVIALLWFLPYVADRIFRSPSRGLACTLVFPAAVTTVEYLNGLIFGTWGSVAYTQYENLPLMQLARASTPTLHPGLITRIISLIIWSASTYCIAVKDMATSKLRSGKGSVSPLPSRNSTTPSNPSFLTMAAASPSR